MPEVAVVTQTDYYSITNELSFNKHSSFDEAKRSSNRMFILKHIIGHNPFETNNGGIIKNYASSLHIVSENNEEENIKGNDWEMKLDRFGLTYGYSYTTMWVIFTDSFGYSGTETFGISAQGFVEAYKRFQQLIAYKGYRLATVSLERDKLRDENKELKERIASLTNENNTLRLRLSEMA